MPGSQMALKRLAYGGQTVTPAQFGEWVPIVPGGVNMAAVAVGAAVQINPSVQPFKEFVSAVKRFGYLVNIHHIRFRVFAGITVSGAGVDARATELQHACCWQLDPPTFPYMSEAYMDQGYTFAQMRLEANDILAGPVSSYLRPNDDAEGALFNPTEFWGLIAGGAATFGRGAYGKRSELSEEYQVRRWQTSLNTFQIQSAAGGNPTDDTFVDLVWSPCAFSGNAANDCLPAEAFLDVTNPVVFQVTRLRNLLGTLIPNGGGAAVAYPLMEVTAYVSYTKIGDLRPVGVPWRMRRHQLGNQTDLQFEARPYLAIVHSAVYDDVATGDAPMTSILFSPSLYNGIDAANIQLFDGCGDKIWPLSDNLAQYAPYRQFIAGWNRQAALTTRWPRLEVPRDMTAGTGVLAGIANRWSTSGLPNSLPYDATDGRQLVFGYTADEFPHAIVAYNNFAASGFPRGFYGFKGTGQLKVQVTGFVLPNNAPAAAANVVYQAYAISPDEQPGNRETDRWKFASYAMLGHRDCACIAGKVQANPMSVQPVIDSEIAGRGSSKHDNLMPLVPWLVKTDNI